MKHRTFRAKVKDAPQLRQELAAGTATGEVELICSVYGIPDTHVAVGNDRQQIIDLGSFREWTQTHDFENDPPLGFVDHGGAIETGSYSSLKMIGFASSGEELAPGDARLPESIRENGGLLLRTHYNLDKQVAREAYSDLIHNPKGVQFSFSWADEEVELRDGEQHVTKMRLTEWSQVAFGAQRKAQLVGARASAAKLDGLSLEALPNEIRSAWWEQFDSVSRALEGYAWIEEAFASSAEAKDGFVIIHFEDGRFGQVPWMRMNDDSIGFDTSKSEELEQEWVTTGKALTGDDASRAAALASRSPKALEDAAREGRDVVELLQSDPVAEFYKTMLNGPGSLTQTADA